MCPWNALCTAVANLRDARLRHYYGQRYDSRTNVADWDYHVSTHSRIRGTCDWHIPVQAV